HVSLKVEIKDHRFLTVTDKEEASRGIIIGMDELVPFSASVFGKSQVLLVLMQFLIGEKAILQIRCIQLLRGGGHLLFERLYFPVKFRQSRPRVLVHHKN